MVQRLSFGHTDEITLVQKIKSVGGFFNFKTFLLNGARGAEDVPPPRPIHSW